MRPAVSFSALVLAIALTACSFAPRYKVPETVATPVVYHESGTWKPAQPVDWQARGPWWTAFGDDDLNALEARVVPANQDLRAAFARLAQARAQAHVARSALFPTITVGPEVSRTRESKNSSRYQPGTSPLSNDFLLVADASYELDLWGRVRNGVRSANASAQASAADLATLDLSLHAELASNYFALRSTDAQVAILDQTVADYERAYSLTQNLHKGGAASASDIAQARAQLESAKTQAADIRLRRAQLQHAIAVLVGESASAFEIAPAPAPIGLAPPGLDPGLPSALLERRPDVAAAERRVAAANADIGVARAAYFPVFSLAASAGYDSTNAQTWIEAPSSLWSLGSSAVLTAFDAGRHRALSQQARAVYDETVANYRGSVLDAFREVEDNIAAIRQLEQEAVSQDAAVDATQSALQQANNRYKAGIVTYLEVVTTENAALQAQLLSRDIQLRRFVATIQLVKALGGGWQPDRIAQANAGNEKHE